MLNNTNNTNNMNIIYEVVNFCEKEVELYNKIINNVPNITLNSLYKMTKNLVLTKIIFDKYKYNKYFNIAEALTKLDDKHILIFIEELELYLVFTKAYTSFDIIDIIYSKFHIFRSENVMGMISYCTTYQVVLSNQRQKLTFTITGSDDDINDVRKYCCDLFKRDAVINNYNYRGDKKYNEITVQLYVNELKESTTLIEELKDYLHATNPVLRKRVEIHSMDDIIYDNKRYYLSFIGKTAEKEDSEYFECKYYEKILKYTPEDNDKHNEMNDINQKIKALKWLSANLPKDGDSIDNVYNSYKMTSTANITALMFNNIIISLGYYKKKVNNMYVWKISI